MYSRCPHCDAQQRVSAQQLRDSRGLLSCKHCGLSFDALQTLSEKADDTVQPHRRVEPSFETGNRRRKSWVWGGTSVFMLVLLMGQVVYFDGLRLYGQPAVHAALSRVCQALDCRLPVLNNPDEWTVSHSELQPQLNSRYWLTAALSNQAEMTQAYPRLKLTLMDFNGQILAERIFAPRQYVEQRALAANETIQIRLPLMIVVGDVGGFTLTTL